MNIMTPNTPKKPLGLDSRIRTMMQIHDLSVPQAAKLCDLSEASFTGYMAGKNLPGATALMALADGLGCSADWLLKGNAR